jgi:hypothetical protein
MIDFSSIRGLVSYEAASEVVIQETENRLEVNLPNDYKELLRQTNGLSIDGGLFIYGTEDIVERNNTWEVDKYAPGTIAIGDDGGGNVFLMYTKQNEKEVLAVDCGDMNPNHAVMITPDFSKWVNDGFIGSTENNLVATTPDSCKIVLVTAPREGLKGLVKIKGVLGIEISPGELLKASKHPPYTLIESYPYGKAMMLIEKLGPVGDVLEIEEN